MHPDLQPLLEQTFGTRVELLNVRVVNQHTDYRVLIVALRQPALTVVLKLAGPDAPLASDFERIARLHQLVAAQTSIPIADILAVGVFDSWRYLMKTHIPGDEWRSVYPQLDAEQKQDAYRQIGAAIREIHAIKFPAFGELDAPGMADYRQVLQSRARLSIKNPALQAIMLSVLEQYTALFDGLREPCLCHEDLHHHNVLFRHTGKRWELATILDFEKAWAGHAAIDLARLEFWDGMMGEGFWSGYGAVHDPLYEQRRLIYQLFWCLEYAAPTERHLRDTQRLCEALGIAAIKAFK